MGKTKSPALYSGNYWARAKHCTDQAQANPGTPCYRCGRTLDQHPRTRSGKPPRWSAGHAKPNDPQAPLHPEVLGCNVAERNTRIGRPDPHSGRW